MTFLEEINQQPEALKSFIGKYFNNYCEPVEQFKSLIKENTFNQVIFTGMGSSLFASYIPCNYLRKKGIEAFAFEAHELFKYDQSIITDETLLILVSQSGESEEVIEFCKGLKNQKNVVVVTNYDYSTLYKFGNIRFEIFAGDERTTASKSYTNTLAMLLYIAYIITGEKLDVLKENFLSCLNKMEEILGTYNRWLANACDFLENSSYISVVGSGPSYSTASHAELVLGEAGGICSSRYTTGQFIHGPIELINESFKAIILDFDPDNVEKVDRIVSSIIKYDGKAFIITNRDIQIKHENLYVFKIDHYDAPTSPIIEILPIELITNELGLRKNRNPGILSRVVK